MRREKRKKGKPFMGRYLVSHTEPGKLAGVVAEVVAYLSGLKITQGQGSGEKLVLLSWQKRFLKGAFSTSGDAALSIGRGNGKSTLIAAICTAYLGGPLRALAGRSEVIAVASSFEQGRIIYEHVLAFLRESGHTLTNRKIWRVQDSANRASITYLPTGIRLRCIGSDPRRAHGLAPVLVIADEAAQWEPSKAERMHSALRTAMGKIPGARLIAIGTRPDSTDHFFSKLLAGGADYTQIHAAEKTDPPGLKKTWLKANPSLPFMPELEMRIRGEWKAARKDSALLPGFQALRLNAGTPDAEQSTLLEADTWSEIETERAAMTGPLVLGLDLGTSAAMSAGAGYFPQSGALKAFAVFPELPSLADREVKDGTPERLYRNMAARGELLIAGLRVADISALLREALRRWGAPAFLVVDRWRVAELREVLQKISFPVCGLSIRGQGFRDGGEDVRLFRKAVLGGKVRPEESLLLRSAMAEARVMTDPAANAKLSKRTQGGRRANAKDDAAAAAILAVAEGARRFDALITGGGAAAQPAGQTRIHVC